MKTTQSDYLNGLKRNLATRGISFHSLQKQSPLGWTFIAATTFLFYLLLTLMVTGKATLFSCVLLGLFMAIHVQYIMHESVHNTLFKNKAANKYAYLYSSGVVSYYEFRINHKNHHAHTNHISKDLDYYNLGDFLGITPRVDYKWWHKWPHLMFYLALPIFCIYNAVQRLILSPIAAVKSKQNTRYKLFHLIVWSIFLCLLNIWPLFVYNNISEAIAMVVLPRAVQWYVFINLFQMSHYHNPRSTGLKIYRNEERHNCYFTHILATTQNVAEKSRISQFLLVGNQVEHHLVPQISGLNTHFIIDFTKEFAAKKGIEHHCAPTFWAQIEANYLFYRSKGFKLNHHQT